MSASPEGQVAPGAAAAALADDALHDALDENEFVLLQYIGDFAASMGTREGEDPGGQAFVQGTPPLAGSGELLSGFQPQARQNRCHGWGVDMECLHLRIIFTAHGIRCAG